MADRDRWQERPKGICAVSTSWYSYLHLKWCQIFWNDAWNWLKEYIQSITIIKYTSWSTHLLWGRGTDLNHKYNKTKRQMFKNLFYKFHFSKWGGEESILQTLLSIKIIHQTIHHYHHLVMPSAGISLTLSRHPSLSFITFGRSSGLHPISLQSCCV